MPYYRIAMRAISAKLHRDLPPTTDVVLWRVGPGRDVRYAQWRRPARRVGQRVAGKALSSPSIIPCMARKPASPKSRAVVHLHGGKTPPESDGYPEDWYVPGQSRVYHYPNQQDAALLWYHDHAMGINRLNVYAGLFGLYIVRDAVEDALHLPSGKYEVPLVLLPTAISSATAS